MIELLLITFLNTATIQKTEINNILLVLRESIIEKKNPSLSLDVKKEQRNSQPIYCESLSLRKSPYKGSQNRPRCRSPSESISIKSSSYATPFTKNQINHKEQIKKTL